MTRQEMVEKVLTLYRNPEEYRETIEDLTDEELRDAVRCNFEDGNDPMVAGYVSLSTAEEEADG